MMALGKDDLLDKFGPCIGIIEHRANCLKELSKLNGRLQLLVSQIKRNTQEEDSLRSDNVLVFDDNDDSSNSELEDGLNKQSSDDEWEEGAEDDDDDENQENGDENMESEDDDRVMKM
ncbi:hypothetical protein EVAR_69007_1 [Eumeta japonica]|uniref:Uncharacterized protein n=1 Tax=Eumeta variegata TaxID=151549 RepID=A0A4C1SJU2_EUMVA|nr:hypothetical protein EVAR_69007_1 [Eumeta japonica]